MASFGVSMLNFKGVHPPKTKHDNGKTTIFEDVCTICTIAKKNGDFPMAMLLYLSGIWVRLIFREHCGGQIGDLRIKNGK